MIKPALAARALYYPSRHELRSSADFGLQREQFTPGDPDLAFAALVTHVRAEHLVNLVVFDHFGGSHGRSGVFILPAYVKASDRTSVERRETPFCVLVPPHFVGAQVQS